MKKLFYLFLIPSMFLCASCSDDDSSEQTITVESGKLNQTVYADGAEGESKVKFTTTDAWTSLVDYSSTRASENEQSDWVTISPNQGSAAGEYEVGIALGVNTTGEDRSANIRIKCNLGEMTISIVQKRTKEDGTVPAIIAPAESVFTPCQQSYKQVCSAWITIDNQCSSLDSRQSLIETHSLSTYFWKVAYESIYYSNLFIEEFNLGLYSESDKAYYTSKASVNRAAAYFYLKTLFGGVPFTTSSEIIESSIPRTSAENIIYFVNNSYLEAIGNLQSTDSLQIMMMAKINLQESNFNQTVNLSRKLLSDYQFIFRDTNRDGVIDRQDDNTNTIIAFLILTEAYFELGQTNEALQYINSVNQVYGQTPLTVGNDIFAAIRGEYSKLSDTGMKFLNAVRWNDTQSWGYRALLPIPQSALDKNPLLTQNTGW